jgi:hypothetical protein
MRMWIAEILVTFILMSSGAAFAVPCVPGSLDGYVGLGSGGCEIADVNFSAFELPAVLTGATPIGAELVNVTPVTSSGNPGLSFTFLESISAGTDELLELLIGFRVAAPGASISGNSAELLGTSVNGDGAITLVEDKCIGGLFGSPPTGCSGTPLTLIAFDIGIDADLFASSPFAPAQALDVLADLVLDGGVEGSASLAAGGGAQLRFETVNQVPEPASAALLALGLFAFAVSAIRSKPRSNLA